VRRPCPPRRSLRATRRGRSLYSSGSLAVAGAWGGWRRLGGGGEVVGEAAAAHGRWRRAAAAAATGAAAATAGAAAAAATAGSGDGGGATPAPSRRRGIQPRRRRQPRGPRAPSSPMGIVAESARRRVQTVVFKHARRREGRPRRRRARFGRGLDSQGRRVEPGAESATVQRCMASPEQAESNRPPWRHGGRHGVIRCRGRSWSCCLPSRRCLAQGRRLRALARGHAGL